MESEIESLTNNHTEQQELINSLKEPVDKLRATPAIERTRRNKGDETSDRSSIRLRKHKPTIQQRFRRSRSPASSNLVQTATNSVTIDPLRVSSKTSIASGSREVKKEEEQPVKADPDGDDEDPLDQGL